MDRNYDHAELLYQILPSLYRERDQNGDLRKYLKGCGRLLDQMHRTLLQRYADIFPDTDGSFELASQPWLLPYMAALLDVRLTSPLEAGQRREISRAIAWRKAKGTLPVVEEVAEALGGLEVVVHEGWRRVATTPRIGMPLLDIAYYGYAGNTPNWQHAPLRARHPGLPAGTVDLRCPGGAVAAKADNPAARTSRVDGQVYRWRQTSLHGSPSCHAGHSVLPVAGRQADWMPGGFADPTVRTIDLRTPNWRQGHHHPRRVLLYTATHAGFFMPTEHRFQWTENLLQREAFLTVASVEVDGPVTRVRNRSLDQDTFTPIIIRGRVELEHEPDGVGPSDPSVWSFEGFIFIHTLEVDAGRLVLERCAVLAAEVHSTDQDQAVLQAKDCLFKRVQVARGLTQMQYCTVLTTTVAERLYASDCIFHGLIQRDLDESTPGEGCLRYSAIRPQQNYGDLTVYREQAAQVIFHNATFSQAGCAVLHPATPASIRQGAEDGGEMGAYHHLHIAARHTAVLGKLQDFVPTGIKPVLIPDHTLHDLPGEIDD
jgi:hypothetical protein